ncbi:hypothetical protein [Bacillus sp. NSP9.1]|uniref:hypothetical protein n=1 Tax=Bacillus sp. NSP9.1 TaxID=1071078 RepID=UPI0004139939|nr:hypothetical protein [Bacillus sp. NSP9.1]QHZ47490.1 hypothetical protein M654_014905 [Bacillus sp. NSP9.1]
MLELLMAPMAVIAISVLLLSCFMASVKNSRTIAEQNEIIIDILRDIRKELKKK